MDRKKFHVVYILPSRYDDEGYIHRYVWGVLPSNTLTCLSSLTRNAGERGSLGSDVDLSVELYDDSVHRIDVRRIVRNAELQGARLLVGLVGVQSNQFPRAADLARQFRAHGAQVMLGGFHVSGVIALFHEPSAEIQSLMDEGVTIVSGEVEAPGVMEGILRDALEGAMKPLYRISETPDITDAPVPAPDPKYLKRFIGRMGTIDTSRGCPFNCSFCTIINVQGKKMRHRSAECMLRSIEEHYQQGILYYFFTDDNFSRSPVWKELFAGLKEMRERGVNIQFMMQVDTQAWKIPGFIEQAAEAGCFLTFIGMESVNEDNIKASGKRQNKVHQYAEMVQAWHDANVLVHVGFIIGFPFDTVESIRNDLYLLKDQIKVDEASFFMLTPLPGSRDHLEMVNKKVPLDADLNNYDSFHETFRHPRLNPGEWQSMYVEAWDTFYSKENMINVLLRTPADRYWRMFWLGLWNRYATLHRTHTMITGFLRRKDRMARRPSFPRESLPRYTWRRARDIAEEVRIIGQMFVEYQEIWLLTRKRETEPLHAVLGELRSRWAEAHQRVRGFVSAQNLQGASEELGVALRAVASRIGDLASSHPLPKPELKQKLARLAEEIEEYRYVFSKRGATPETVADAQEYLNETLAEYEETAIRPVARRRLCNSIHRRVIEKLKTGRVLSPVIFIQAPRAVYHEVVLGARFLWAFLHASVNRLRTA